MRYALANNSLAVLVILMSHDRTLKEGAHVTYNGTDFLQLDHCSGLIRQVDMAQDYITLYHKLGLAEIKV